MDAPRHRFRREEPEPEASGEGVSGIDFRLVSIEDELKTVSLSSAMQARDFQALRAKVETLESRSGEDVEHTLTRVFEHVDTQDDRIEQVFDRLQVLDNHLQKLNERLDNLGDIGPLENLPNLLEQSLITSLDDLEARLELKIEALERARKDSADVAGQGELSGELQAKLDSKIEELRRNLDEVLEDRYEELAQVAQSVSEDASPAAIREALGADLEPIRQAIIELQESYESVPSRDELEQAVSRGGQAPGLSSASSDDLTALAGELTVLKEKFATLSTQMAALGTDGDLQAQLEKALEFSEQAEKHQERVDEAIRMVSELEEKTQNLGSQTGAAAMLDDGLTPPPGETQLKLTLRDLVREMVKNRVSDLHIKTGRAITARIGKELIQFSTPPLTPADSYHLIASALRSSHRKRLVEERDIEFVYQYESIRLRANVFFDRGNLSATFKMLSNRPPELENLGLPKAFSGLLSKPSGLILVCGLPGSGRTTTLTASVDYLNRTKQLHLVSLEDRLEYTHEDRRSLVTQRELDSDIVSFAQGAKRAMGQDSDVIFIADLSDRPTLEAVFSAVDSGLLVVGAVTAQNAEEAIPKLINLFPEQERRMRARLFARVLQGVLSLKLFERADGEGQIPASELMIATGTVKRLIEDANLSALHRQVAGGGAEGMQAFAESIERLIETGLITSEAGRAELDRLSGATRRPAAPTTAPAAAPVRPTISASSTAGTGSPPTSRTAPAPAIRKPPQVVAPPPTAPVRPETPPARTGPLNPPTVAPPSSEERPAVQKPRTDSQDPDSFGEEDTLMNWL